MIFVLTLSTDLNETEVSPVKNSSGALFLTG